MKTRMLIVSQALVWTLFAVLLLFAGTPLLSWFAEGLDTLSITLAHILGAELIGLAIISFATRYAAGARRSPLILGYAICNAIGAAAAGTGLYTRAFNARGWLLVGIYLCYALAFAAVWARSEAGPKCHSRRLLHLEEVTAGDVRNTEAPTSP